MKYKNKSGTLISLKVDASNVNEDAQHRFVSDNEKNTYDGKVTALGGDLSNTKINNFDSVTTEFPIPEPGESTKTILGKMRKFLQDFNTFKTNIITLSKLANNLTTTSVGMALDARQGKVLKDEINTLNGSLDTLKDKTTYQVRHQSLANTSVNLWDTWTDCELYKLYMPKTGICVMSGCISYLKSTPYPDGVVIGRCYNMTTTRASGIATETQITGCNFSALFYVTGGDMVPLYLRSGNQKGWVTLSDNEANNYVEYFVV